MDNKAFFDGAENELMHIYRFWEGLLDDENGGYYGKVDYELSLDKSADKGVILNSRILWFFSNVYLWSGNPDSLSLARHAYDFFRDFCIDVQKGGVYWLLDREGSALDDMKHTYNQAFAVYGLASYYRASGDIKALTTANSLFRLIEEKSADSMGYAEAFDREWKPTENEKLSEDGYDAKRTMNTLLHIAEAYTELYIADKNGGVLEALKKVLTLIYNKVYDKDKHILGVYFDEKMKPLGNVYSYGHDIEASWLIDRALDAVGEFEYSDDLRRMNREIAEKVYSTAYSDGVIFNQELEGRVDKTRIWWIQAEGVVGFLNAYEHTKEEKYLRASKRIFERIREDFVDKRKGGEWYYALDSEGRPIETRNIVEQWKCPYHNGRMCMEVMSRYDRL